MLPPTAPPAAPAPAATAVLQVVPLVTTRALARALDYRAPGPDVPPIGAVVDVPLGPRRVRGIVVGLGSSGPEAPASAALREAIDLGFRIPADLVELALRVAERYGSTPARVLTLVTPPPARPAAPVRWARALAGPESARGTRQRAVLEALREGPLTVDVLRAATGATAATVGALERRGVLAVAAEGPSPGGAAREPAPRLTADQAVAVERLVAAVDDAVAGRASSPLLLHGVTGSGKTEVFLRGLEHCLAVGRGAIVLVPEIALAPQTAGRIAARFGGRVAQLHSQLSAGERAREHMRILSGEAAVVVGPRSAVWAPVPRLGLIVVDEEHESAYKQGEDPRYDARAVAVLRGRAHGAAVLAASATPRPESWHALERLRLPERIGGRLPPVEVVDLRRDGLYPLSRPLLDGLSALHHEGGRAILLLNRRGEAAALQCRSCGRGFACRDCDVSLTLHGAPARLVCHHCGRRRPAPRACPSCGAVDLSRLGAGTERLEAALTERFPGLEVLRLDADATSRKGALEEVLARFDAAERAVLVGTQLVAKGHHFEGVRLAAAVDADVGLAQPDFRAEERTFSLLVQLAGRAGRAGTEGRVLVQTWEPDARVIRLAARHAVDEFLDGELVRREALGYPPFRRLVRVLVTAPRPDVAVGSLAALVERARPLLDGDALLGPVPLFRVRGRARAHVIVKTLRPGRAGAVFGGLLADASASLRRDELTAVVDVDPQAL